MLKQLPTVKSASRWPAPEFIQSSVGIPLEIITNHYKINTTLSDPLILRQVPVFLESAFHSYCEVIGRSVESDQKLQVYFFQSRDQWDDFTRRWAGPLAPIYLKITSGAYYLNGACVTYHIGRQSNFSVLAHEGWHQFSDELFVYRLPAWLDEGLATSFEGYEWKNGRVNFDPRLNGSRLFSLKETLARDRLFGISDLLDLDAGRVLSHTNVDPDNPDIDPKLAAYYAQTYALVRFLREYDYGRHLQSFRIMLNDARVGRWPLDAVDRAEALQRDRNPSRRWNETVGRLIFKTYIAGDAGEIEGSYYTFCHEILARVRFKKQS